MTRILLLIAFAAPILANSPLHAGPGAGPAADGPLARDLGADESRQSHCCAARKHRPQALSERVRSDALVRVASANRKSVREPDPAFYLGAAQLYPFSDGALYRLYAAPEQISDIALQPGEGLVSVAAGDTARWVIGDTASGSGADRRTHILVKPIAAGLRTNIVIATDRRIYHVEAVSTAATAMATISWTYPADSLIRSTLSPASLQPPVAAPAVAVETLNFDYRIEGDDAPWRPVRAFDDGRQVFIQFPPSLAEGEAPPLFMIGERGNPVLLNYRISGRYYVVDRLFAEAELRLGGKHQQIVRIVRVGPGPRPRRAA